MIRVFISYRHDDVKEEADRIYKYLSDSLDFDGETVIDRHLQKNDITELIERVRQSDVLLALIGEKWINILQARQNVPDETDLLLEEIHTGLTTDGVLVIPVLIDAATHIPSSMLPPKIVSLAYKEERVVSTKSEVQFNYDMEQLLDRIKKRHERHAGAIRIYRTLPDDLLNRMIERAKKHIKILCIWSLRLEANRDVLISAVKRGVNVQIALLHPDNLCAIQRSRDLNYPDDFTSRKIHQNIEMLSLLYRDKRLSDADRSRFEIKLVNATPSRVLFIVDEGVLIGSHPVNKMSAESPHTLVFGANTELYKSVYDQFIDLWNSDSSAAVSL